MFSRLGILVVLLVAVCAGRADATKATTGGHSASSAVYRYEVSWQNGDSGDAGSVPNTCGAFAVSFFEGEGGGADVEIFGSRDTTSANGVSLATITATSAVPVVVRTAFPQIVVNIDAAPASGTARAYLVCAASASGGGAVASSTSVVAFDVFGESAAGLATTDCLGHSNGDWTTGLAVACNGATGATTSAAKFPVGVQVYARSIACSGTATAPAGTLVLGIDWRSGSAPGTQTPSTATLSIPAASLTDTLLSATINSQCPYAATGCLAGVRVRTALGAAAAANIYCDVLFETS